MKSIVLAIQFSATTLLTSTALASSEVWICKAEFASELTVEFTENAGSDVTKLNFFDDDSWTPLNCKTVRTHVVSEPEYLCSFEDESRYLNASINHQGRSMLKIVNLLEIDRFTNETITTEFECKRQ